MGNSPRGRKQLDITEQAHTALCASPLDFTGASNSLGWKQNSALPNLFLCILPSLGPCNYPRLLSYSLHSGSLQDLFCLPKNSQALFHSPT